VFLTVAKETSDKSTLRFMDHKTYRRFIGLSRHGKVGDPTLTAMLLFGAPNNGS